MACENTAELASLAEAVASALPEKEMETAQATQSPVPTATATVAPAEAAPVEAAPVETPNPVQRTKYTVRLEMEPEKGVVEGEMRVDFVNNTSATLYELVLRLWPNAVEKGCMKIGSVTQDEADTFYTLSDDGTTLFVPVNHDLVPGGEASVFLTFRMTVPERTGRFGKNDLGVMLGNALPILAVVEDGEWRVDPYVEVGDPFYSDLADYQVLIRCPLTYTVAASGTAGEARIVDSTVFEGLFTAAPARDFAVALIEDANPKDVQVGDVRVTGYDRFKDRAALLAETSAGALRYFAERLGPYPFDDFSAVGTELTGGMEYPGLIMVEHDRLTGSTALGELYIAHEVAHQWFYGIAGSDTVNTPWIDEALVEFLSFDYTKSVYGEEYTSELMYTRFYGMTEHTLTLPMDAPLADYAQAGTNEYVYGVYGRGVALYTEVYEKLGAEKFYAALKTLCDASREAGFITRAQLIKSFSDAAGEDLTPLFDKHLAAPAASGEQQATGNE
ncbi:MAG: M1 family metallopeptidase [Clostridia bacterium]|nr:M1 family metallopeptidase [Clostridia bacterium]